MVWLTKSRLLSGLQCHKRLWFEIHQPLEVSVEPSTAIVQGRVFDDVVQRLHPGVVISRSNGMLSAIAETQSVLAKGSNAPSPLYQPAFQAAGLTVIADVLRRRDDSFELVEVKATTQVKEMHLPDAGERRNGVGRYVISPVVKVENILDIALLTRLIILRPQIRATATEQ
jgi:hypothetical protein